MDNEVTISNRGDLYTIKISDMEGIETLMVTADQLGKLKLLLNTLHIPLADNELPLWLQPLL